MTAQVRHVIMMTAAQLIEDRKERIGQAQVQTARDVDQRALGEIGPNNPSDAAYSINDVQNHD